MTYMLIRSISYKFSGTDLTKCNTRTVIRVDISGNLKDKSGEFRFFRFHFSFFSLHRTRTRSYFHETVQQLLNTEVIQSRSKEYRCTVTR